MLLFQNWISADMHLPESWKLVLENFMLWNFNHGKNTSKVNRSLLAYSFTWGRNTYFMLFIFRILEVTFQICSIMKCIICDSGPKMIAKNTPQQFIFLLWGA